MPSMSRFEPFDPAELLVPELPELDVPVLPLFVEDPLLVEEPVVPELPEDEDAADVDPESAEWERW